MKTINLIDHSTEMICLNQCILIILPFPTEWILVKNNCKMFLLIHEESSELVGFIFKQQMPNEALSAPTVSSTSSTSCCVG